LEKLFLLRWNFVLTWLFVQVSQGLFRVKPVDAFAPMVEEVVGLLV